MINGRHYLAKDSGIYQRLVGERGVCFCARGRIDVAGFLEKLLPMKNVLEEE